MTFQKRITQAFTEEAARRADAAEPRLTKTDIWKAAGASSGAATHWFNGSNGMDMATCMKVAPLLRVNAQWLYDGTGPKRPISNDAGDAPVPPSSAPWPFPEIPEDQVRALPPAKLSALQGAMALAIAQMNMGITVAPASVVQPAAGGAIRTHKPGGLVDIDHADDAFPMRMPGLPAAPWEGGKTTLQAETERPAQISAQAEVVANVGPGEPHAANDEFEEVPELADVRLAAGDGIENHSEEQTGVVLFRKSFLRSVGADNGRGRVVYAKGDSMDPDIKDGWALLVVASDCLTPKDLIPGEFYAVNYDGKMIVKLIEKDDLTGRWVAKSTNKSYRDIPLENGASVRILGQVAWAGGRLTARNAGKRVRS